MLTTLMALRHNIVLIDGPCTMLQIIKAVHYMVYIFGISIIIFIILLFFVVVGCSDLSFNLF